MLKGQRILPKEDPVLLTGRASFVADLQRPGMLHAAVLRSPHAHATIKSIDVEAAKEAPGVTDVVTFSDIPEPSTIPMRLAPRSDLIRALQYPLADDRVRYVGEPVAVVVARSRYEAEDALPLIDVDYEILPALVSAKDAIAAGGPVLHDQVPDNIPGRLSVTNGNFDEAAKKADHVLVRDFYTQRHSGTPMECRGLIAEPSEGGQTITVWGPTKVAHFNRMVLAKMLGMSESRIRFVEPRVGGGFGIRGEFYPEDFLIPWLALKNDRPIVWIEDRLEYLISANHSREQWHTVSVAFFDDGRILGLKDVVINDMGGYIRTHGATVPTMTAAYLPGPYAIEHYDCEALCVLTNKTPAGTYRAPGRFEATFVRERAFDMIAEELGLDPAEVRRRNFVQKEQMPYATGSSAFGGQAVVYDSGDYPKQFEAALEKFGYEELRNWCADERAKGRAVGIGIGCFVEKSGLGPWEYGRVEMDSLGGVTVHTGAASLGQGIETVLVQIVADELSLDAEKIRVVHGDTATIPYGGGSFASRGTVTAGSSAQVAAQAVRLRLLELASQELEVAAQDLVMEDGSFSVKGSPGTAVSFARLAELATPNSALGLGLQPGLSEEAFFEAEEMVYPYGVHLALVEVDPDTLTTKVLKYLIAYDVGKAINPMLIDGQLVGGAAQGIGGTLLEEFSYDDLGQPLNASFMDYLIPTAVEIPTVETLITEDAPSPRNPLGVKGAGEGGVTAAGAAIAGAVANALGLNLEIASLPLSPGRLYEMQKEKSSRVSDQGAGGAVA